MYVCMHAYMCKHAMMVHVWRSWFLPSTLFEVGVSLVPLLHLLPMLASPEFQYILISISHRNTGIRRHYQIGFFFFLLLLLKIGFLCVTFLAVVELAL